MIKISTNVFAFNIGMESKRIMVDKAVKQALLNAGYLVHSKAIRNIQQKHIIDTGRLMGSVSVAWSWGPGNGTVQSPAKPSDAVKKPFEKETVIIGTNVFYAPFHEFGTRKMKARPYLRPAFSSSKEIIKKMVNDAIKGVL